MGGSDQWGNITTGTELIRRMGGGDAYALTSPLITKADGTKFGKSEGGNVWLDAAKTSPYQFYQFWLNSSDEDAAKYIKIFTLLSQAEIEKLAQDHAEAPHLRILQKALAEDITTRVHSAEALQKAIEASNILFGKATEENLKNLSEADLLSIFEGVPQTTLSLSQVENPIAIVDFLTENVKVFSSKGEARRTLTANAVSINKNKVAESKQISKADVINDTFILVQNGKKNYHLVMFQA
jgi:tyrosyl-tRNA synthetase